MASSKIKGITIEIDGDTTKLGKALESAEGSSRSLQSELRGIDSLLKLDPSNVELLTQKQKVLTEAISSTEDKLKTLKNAQAQVQAQFDKGEITEQQYRDFQREIVVTESKLKSLENQAKEFGSVSSQQLKEVQKQMEEYGKKAQDAGNKVSDAGTSMLGMTAAVAGVATAGVMYNMEMETLEANLETLLGSTEAANERLEELRTMGAKTPFETTDLVKATQKMLAFGLDADKTNGYLSTLGDIAMGDANKLDSLTLAFSQIGAAGKATMEDVNQMVDAGFNPLTYIMKETGETMTEVRDRVSAGKVSFEEIAGAMQKATSEGGPFYQSMERASETTAGKISTLKDSISMLVGTLTESLMPVFEKIIDKLAKFAEWFSNLSPAIQEIIIKVGLIVAAIGPALIIIGKIITAVGTIIPIIAKLGGLLVKAGPILTAIKGAIMAVVTALGWPVVAIAAVIAAIVLLWNKCEWFRNAVKAIWEAIKAGFQIAFEWIKGVLEGIGQFFVDLWTKITTIFSNVAGWFNTYLVQPISTAFQAIMNFINQYIIQPLQSLWNDYIYPIVSKIIEIIKKVVEIIFSLYIGIAIWIYQNVIQPIIQYATNLFNKIKTIITNLWNKIVEVFSKVASWVNKNVISPITNAINSFKEKAINVFTTIWNKITSVFGKVGSWFKGKFQDAYNGITSIFSKLGSFFSGIWSKISSTFSSLGTKIGDAIGGAVKSGINRVISFIENTINKAIGLINGAIGLINKLPGVSVGKLSKLSLPRLATGTNYVPYDEMPAVLHKGEQVVPKKYNPEVNDKHLKNAVFDALTSFTNTKVQNKNTAIYGINELTNLLKSYMPEIIANMDKDLILDGKKVGQTIAPEVNRQLGYMAQANLRGR